MDRWDGCGDDGICMNIFSSSSSSSSSRQLVHAGSLKERPLLSIPFLLQYMLPFDTTASDTVVPGRGVHTYIYTYLLPTFLYLDGKKTKTKKKQQQQGFAYSHYVAVSEIMALPVHFFTSL